MQNLPRIFDENAKFIDPPDTSMFDAPTLERLAGVRVAYNNLKNAEAAEKAARDFIGSRLEAIQAAEDYQNKHFPPKTQYENWLDNFGSVEDRRQHEMQKQKSAASKQP